jgi:TPR repeat protein
MTRVGADDGGATARDTPNARRDADRTATTPGAPPRDPVLDLHRYRMREQIGAGGMGEVHAAYDTMLGRDVAIKIVATGDPVLELRLLREARALAQIRHANVVPIYDVGVAGGRVHVVMPLVAGGSLKQWLAERRAWRAILDRFVAAGRGLVAAHAAGLVHRDFKPDNVLLAGDDVLVADFGLARVPLRGATDRARAPELTADGAIAGTLPYMAPEQLEGEPLDARCDQFAFATALWEALYRTHPFARDGIVPGDAATLYEQIERGPGAAPFDDVPPRIEIVLRRALAFRASDRWISMDELLRELAAAARPRRRAIVAAAAIGGVAVVVAIVAVVASSRDRPEHAATVSSGSGASVVAPPASPPDAAGATITTACGGADECRRACDAGGQAACIALGKLEQSGSGTVVDARAAHARFARACELGDRRGCVEAASDLLDGTGIAKDARAGAELMKRACEMDSPSACAVLGQLYERGEGVAKDARAAAAGYHRACELGDSDGCLFEAQAILLGRGVAKDAAKASATFEQLCDRKLADACMMLGHRYATGDGRPRDARRAADAFQRGCDLGSAKACYALADAYRTGAGVPVDRAQSDELYARACRGGFKPACDGAPVARTVTPKPAPAASTPAATTPTPPTTIPCHHGSWGMVCGGSCVNTYNDDRNCGDCAKVCPGQSHCEGGLCFDANRASYRPE